MESELMLSPREKSPLSKKKSPQRRIEPTILHLAGQWAQHTTNELFQPSLPTPHPHPPPFYIQNTSQMGLCMQPSPSTWNSRKSCWPPWRKENCHDMVIWQKSQWPIKDHPPRYSSRWKKKGQVEEKMDCKHSWVNREEVCHEPSPCPWPSEVERDRYLGRELEKQVVGWGGIRQTGRGGGA